jgi:hypothetical protein
MSDVVSTLRRREMHRRTVLKLFCALPFAGLLLPSPIVAAPEPPRRRVDASDGVPDAPGYRLRCYPDAAWCSTIWRIEAKWNGLHYGLEHSISDLEREQALFDVDAASREMLLEEMNHQARQRGDIPLTRCTAVQYGRYQCVNGTYYAIVFA